MLLELASVFLGGQGRSGGRSKGEARVPRWGWEGLSQGTLIGSQPPSHCASLPWCLPGHLEISGASLRSPTAGVEGTQGADTGGAFSRAEAGRRQKGALRFRWG